MSVAARKMAAWVALCATLFGAVSPAVAGALFAGRADVLGRMLALPASSRADVALWAAIHGGICSNGVIVRAGHGGEPASGRNAPDGGSRDSGHAAHGIYCSFCLAAGAAATLPPGDAAACAPVVETSTPVPAAGDRTFAALRPAVRHSRGPPLSPR